MTRYRLNYEPAKIGVGRPWGLEFPDGHREYFAVVAFRVPAWTVLVDGQPRQHGYLECEGALRIDGDTAVIERENDGEEE